MSQGVITSEMMLFEPKPVNEGVEYLQYIECQPTNQIIEDGSVDIHIKGSGSQYLDLQRSRLHVKAKIVRGWCQSGRDRCGDSCESMDAKFV